MREHAAIFARVFAVTMALFVAFGVVVYVAALFGILLMGERLGSAFASVVAGSLFIAGCLTAASAEQNKN